MKKLLFLLFVLSIGKLGFNQKAHDLGIFVGGASYIGDINTEQPLYYPHLAFGGMYRVRYNPRYALRIGAIYSTLEGSDQHFVGASRYQKIRNQSLYDNRFLEGNCLIEFNFFPITDDRHEDNFTPYVASGIGLFYGSQETTSRLQLVIPGVFGVKYRLTKKIELIADMSLRKSFTDNLDDLPTISDYQRQMSNASNKDWYSVYGISILFTVKDGKGICEGYINKR